MTSILAVWWNQGPEVEVLTPRTVQLRKLGKLIMGYLD